MHWDFFDYPLPEHLIAQEPLSRRDQARLLVVDRAAGSLAHRHIHELPELLRPGDLLILNDTQVLPARLLGRRQRSRGKWEGLYLRSLADESWEMLCRSGGRLQPGEIIEVEPGPLRLRLLARLSPGRWQVQPEDAGLSLLEILDKFGHVPLPPYIRKGKDQPADRDRYQTVFAHAPGAVAAPTAGLHFTPELFKSLDQRGIARAFVTLHVGPGTFQPVQTGDIERHPMHVEWGNLPEGTVKAIAACRARAGRVAAVGTTSTRVLETVARAGPLKPWSGETNLFIYPPFDFRVVDVLLTNFHLPRSTLLLLVAAFAGQDLIARAYREAIDRGYRFYSYGDAMLIL